MSHKFPFHQFININNTNNLEPLSPQPENQTQDLQHRFLEEIEKRVSPNKFHAFFKNQIKLEFTPQTEVIIRIETGLIKDILENHYDDIIREVLSLILKKEVSHRYEVKEKKEKKAAPKDFSFTLNLEKDQSQTHKNELVDNAYIKHVVAEHGKISVDSNKTFENFIVGPSNNLAYASCVAVARNPGKSYPTVYIHSKSGLGKTHLLYAVANYIRQNRPELKIVVTTAQNFFLEMVEAIKNEKSESFRDKYTENLDVLIIDDIHELKNKPSSQNAFFHIFNDLYSKGKQLIFTSDKAPKEIDGLEERIKTRLSWGLLLDIQQPDLETRIAILKKKAQEEDLFLSEDVIHLIGSSIKDNIRELEGSLKKLAAFSSIFRQEIDTDIARRELKLDIIDLVKTYSIEKITKVVSQYYKLSVADLKSKTRLKDITNARHIAMYLSYTLAKSNLVEIGKYFGGRDHTTVLHGVNKIKGELKINNGLSQDILKIENSL